MSEKCSYCKEIYTDLHKEVLLGNLQFCSNECADKFLTLNRFTVKEVENQSDEPYFKASAEKQKRYFKKPVRKLVSTDLSEDIFNEFTEYCKHAEEPKAQVLRGLVWNLLRGGKC